MTIPPQARLECMQFWEMMLESTIEKVEKVSQGREKTPKQVTNEDKRYSYPVRTLKETMRNMLQNCPSIIRGGWDIFPTVPTLRAVPRIIKYLPSIYGLHLQAAQQASVTGREEEMQSLGMGICRLGAGKLKWARKHWRPTTDGNRLQTHHRLSKPTQLPSQVIALLWVKLHSASLMYELVFVASICGTFTTCQELY